jgi:hypothetical protein
VNWTRRGPEVRRPPDRFRHDDGTTGDPDTPYQDAVAPPGTTLAELRNGVDDRLDHIGTLR